MNGNEIEFLMRFLSMGTRVLSTRVATYIALIMAFTLFCWAMYDPSWIRTAESVAFAILIVWPLLRHDKEIQREQVTQTNHTAG